MSDFNIRADSVDVEQIMKQIRARIREKRGVDYTEEEIRALANVKLEKFLDPTKIRSDLLEQYRHGRRANPPRPYLPSHPDNYVFEDSMVYGSSRGVAGRLIMLIRKLLNPLLKLMMNPNPIIKVLNQQSAINVHHLEQFDRLAGHINDREKEQFALRDQLDALNYEVLHNLVLEMTRLGIEVKNLKMRVESTSSRLDFDERRARALEGAVQYRPGAARPVVSDAEPAPEVDTASPAAGDAQRSRRRRRRRGGRGRSGPPQPGDARQGEDREATRAHGLESEAGTASDGVTPSAQAPAAETAPTSVEEPRHPADNGQDRDPE